MLGHSTVTMMYDVYGHLFHDPAKDVDLMGQMERGLLTGNNRREKTPLHDGHAARFRGRDEGQG